MKFYERVVLRNIEEFQKLSKEEKRNDLYLFSHKYFARWLSYMLTPLTRLLFITIAVWIISIILNLTIGGDVTKAVFYITAIIEVITVGLCIMLCIKVPSNNVQEFRDCIEQQIRNIQLINWKVLSPKEWRTIKKKDKQLYSDIRSDKCNHWCYSTTISIAETLKNPEIKIIWLCVKPSMEEKCGHAVLYRKGYIYDTNMRKTYKKEKYFKAFHAEVFKEYSIEQCRNIDETYRIFDPEIGEWEKFRKWCEARGAIRND